MFKVILKVLFWLAVAAYGALFMQWNMSEVDVIGLTYQDMAFAVQTPIAYVAFGGVVIGVIIMGLAAAAAWATQRRSAVNARSQLQAAKKKIQERNKKINALREQVEDLQQQVETLKDELKIARMDAQSAPGVNANEASGLRDVIDEEDAE